MLDVFSRMNANWFNRAYVYTGSIGNLFRFRIAQGKEEDEKPILKASTYSRVCYELASDVTEREFPWDDAGVEALKNWLQEQYDQFSGASDA